MFVVIVILVVPLGCLLATVRRTRHRNDPMREREQAFATLRRMAESPRVQLKELAERIPVASGHVRILSERPAGLPRSRRKRPAQRVRTITRRRRRVTTPHPKIAPIPSSLSVTSSPNTTMDNNSRGRIIEDVVHPSNGPDRDRAGVDVEPCARTEGATDVKPVRMTLVRGEAERSEDDITQSHSTAATGVKPRTDASGSKRRPGGSQDALKAAIERAISHTHGMTDRGPRSDESISALFGVPRQSA